MDTEATSATAPTMTLSELADLLSVSTQALYEFGGLQIAPTPDGSSTDVIG